MGNITVVATLGLVHFREKANKLVQVSIHQTSMRCIKRGWPGQITFAELFDMQKHGRPNTCQNNAKKAAKITHTRAIFDTAIQLI